LTFQDHINYNCEITLDTGESYRVYSQWLSNQNLANWKGWQCDAGYKRIYVLEDEIFGGACNQDHLGNFNTGWDILTSPTTCRRETCSVNTDDLLLYKQKINEDRK
jgi:hypothetical protein